MKHFTKQDARSEKHYTTRTTIGKPSGLNAFLVLSSENGNHILETIAILGKNELKGYEEEKTAP